MPKYLEIFTHKFSNVEDMHVGQLLCESKEAHDACMAIMNSHDWDAEIPKQTSFETLKQYV